MKKNQFNIIDHKINIDDIWECIYYAFDMRRDNNSLLSLELSVSKSRKQETMVNTEKSKPLCLGEDV